MGSLRRGDERTALDHATVSTIWCCQVWHIQSPDTFPDVWNVTERFRLKDQLASTAVTFCRPDRDKTADLRPGDRSQQQNANDFPHCRLHATCKRRIPFALDQSIQKGSDRTNSGLRQIRISEQSENSCPRICSISPVLSVRAINRAEHSDGNHAKCSHNSVSGLQRGALQQIR